VTRGKAKGGGEVRRHGRSVGGRLGEMERGIERGREGGRGKTGSRPKRVSD